jgi:very-short-patch-repair endonuclease
MDVFALREKVVSDYRHYIESFVRINDEDINDFVKEQFETGVLWPDAILQLNPAYQPGPTLDELAAQGGILKSTAEFFRGGGGKPLRLYRHQAQAIEIARRWDSYVVTTGTGSGKSLTYLIPIVDHVLRTQPEKHKVRAIIVYPMNALINSQLKALRTYAEANPGTLIRFDCYTGQEKEEAKKRIQDDPPHILLTNYVMLEYMMLRPAERVFTDATTSNLEFLVLDELHTYRGRQGADVAMLMRRLRERSGNKKILNIGTSATVASGGKRDDRRLAAAGVATKLFGTVIPTENVIDESLRRAIHASVPSTGADLRAVVEAPLPPTDLKSFIESPLAAWTENVFGLDEEDGRLVRRKPIKFREGVAKLAEESGANESLCAEKLQHLLALGNGLKNEMGEPVFAFRLHQFLAAGGTLYATLESEKRYFTLEGQHYAPGDDGERLLFPLVFCRECGQEYYLVSWAGGEAGTITPRLPFLTSDEDDEADARRGYLAINVSEDGPLWSDAHAEGLPDFWYEARSERLKKDYRKHVPQLLKVQADGTVGVDDGTEVWFEEWPFLLCLRCGSAFDRTERNEFKKLSRLSNAGRSTATTVVGGSAIVQLREDRQVQPEAQKLMSFTDNRQDASLQAGHFNDFIQVGLLRAALYKALQDAKALEHYNVTQGVFRAIGLDQKLYAKEPAQYGPGKSRNEDSFQRLLEYRLYEDLRRGWRVAQPNLEQCGLLIIDYPGLHEMCAASELWAGHPLLAQSDPATRERVVRAFLDFLRKEMAIDAKVLDAEEQKELRRRIEQHLRDPWALDDFDHLLESAIFLLPPGRPNSGKERSLDPARSRLGKYLRQKALWHLGKDLTSDDGERLIRGLVTILRGNYLTIVPTEQNQDGIQLQAGALQWKLGDGTPPPPDPVRTKRMISPRLHKTEREANRFFAQFYRETARRLVGVEGGAHTGQIPMDLRQDREARFGRGELAALFCSPTMELGVDIRDLNVVHLRNVPPTPANYAQRSGRAGRGGQPALVMAFCSEGSQHDQYFFRQPSLMVAGAVAPARLELGNKELVEAHVHSVWVSAAGLPLGRDMTSVLDLDQGDFPLQADIQHRIDLSDSSVGHVTAECKRILDACGEDVARAPWYREAWIRETLVSAPRAFDNALGRWRELYTAAVRQRDENQAISNRPTVPKPEQREADRRVDEAKREIELLLNRSEESVESDFYPYRYLASEGFLPGYNFPRLPLRALIPTGKTVHVIDRPRFLGLTEFGPRNVIYHEGRKYRMARCVLPPGGIESRLVAAKLCNSCGYFHDGDHAKADRCDHCGTLLDGAHSQYIPTLFEMGTVRGFRVERITCDEEERLREGFEIETKYRFAPAPDGRALQEQATVNDADGHNLLQLTFAPQAELWRVNQRWRRSDRPGFTLDTKTGYWARRPDDDDHAPDAAGNDLRTGVRPFVRDTRNVLLIRPVSDEFKITDQFLTSLGYSLQRGMQLLFQVEQQEIALEQIGEHDNRRLLFWEAAEGGNGIWQRLIEDPNALAKVAEKALDICHFEASTGAELSGWAERCSRACYDCLLSYSNQLAHPLIDRHLIREFLLLLLKSTTTKNVERSRDEQYAWLEERRDHNSTLEGDFLKRLYETGRRLPDRAQYRPEQQVYAEADFYYERDGLPGVCVFCDGPDHDQPVRKESDQRERGRLGDLGYRILTIRYDSTIDEQLVANQDVFGIGTR